MDKFDQTAVEKINDRKTDNIGFILFRLIFVIVIALSIICIRYISPKVYKEIKQYYDDYVSVNITADYYLSEEN